MRLPTLDTANRARSSSVKNFFREMLASRYLWAGTGIAIIGIISGFIFYNDRATLPARTTPPPTGIHLSTARIDELAAPEAAVAGEQSGQTSPETGNDTSAGMSSVSSPETSSGGCNQSAKEQAASVRDDKLKIEGQRYNQVIAATKALTGGLLRVVTPEEKQDHEKILLKIESVYQASLRAAGC